MRPMMIRSIALSEETKEAWRSVGGWYPRRERNTEQALELYQRNEESHVIINLGNTSFSPSVEVLERYGADPEFFFNDGVNILPLVRPGTSRDLLGDLMPPRPTEDDLLEGSVDMWIKAPGSGGEGKRRKKKRLFIPEVPDEWDIQVHVKGQEYRVITVDDKVVQVNARYGENGHRFYQWIGVSAAPREVKQIAKDAARKLNGRNIIGWDTVLTADGQAYIFEGNSCPGVNTATAGRIMSFIAGEDY